jgi:acetolactate synthase-1/2/3 large subunit
LGLSAFPSDHPQYVGMLGMHGNYGPNKLTNKADVIIAVGMRFDDRVTGDLSTYAKQADVIHIDIDQAEIGKNVTPTVGMIADAKQALQALLPLLKENQHADWRAKFDEFFAEEYEKVISKDFTAKGDNIKMGEVIRMLSEKTKGEAVIVADVGQHQMAAARYSKFKQTDSFLTSGGLGTMGYALPSAMGAKVGAPHRQVVAVIGDGCFQMTIQELGTIAQSKIPVKAIILNNSYLGMVRQWQQLFFDTRYSFVNMTNPDFIMVAKGFGVDGHKVTHYDELSEGLDKLLKSEEAYVLEVVVEKEGNIFPMIPAGCSIDSIRLE